MALRNVGILPQNCKVSQPRRIEFYCREKYISPQVSKLLLIQVIFLKSIENITVDFNIHHTVVTEEQLINLKHRPRIKRTQKESYFHFSKPLAIYVSYSSVGKALGCEVDDRGSRIRFQAGAGNFSLRHRFQNGSGAHLTSYSMSTRGPFPGGEADHSPPSNAEVKE
jgi:hypothetical protein